ncbi:MAG TPA: type II secretion system F family protein [Herpetosiphonaceae bacterium]
MGMLIFGALLLFGVMIVVLGFVQSRQSATIEGRLSTFTEVPKTLEEMELELPFSQRVIQPVMQQLLTTFGKASPAKNAGKIKRNLEQAGNPSGLTPTSFMGVRVAVGLIGLVIGFYMTTLMGLPILNRLLFMVLGGAVGYVFPGIWLDRKIRGRKHAILKSMPDALDLLTISVEAGLGFDLALDRVANKWDNELSKEFQRVLSDTRLGTPRRDAMRMMAERCGVEDLSNFVQAIIQAEQLGVSIGKILKVQSEQMRVRRRQRAEELAHQAPIKMLFPMAFLIFPSLLVVILGPAVPRLMGNGVF